MGIKKMIANLLLNLSKSMTKSSMASYGSAGIEDMPESMKNLR
ncbi:hypothetical protein [Clostridium beijerinckii]|nr:hypothetical protein [Clostridium beijerinckii]